MSCLFSASSRPTLQENPAQSSLKAAPPESPPSPILGADRSNPWCTAGPKSWGFALWGCPGNSAQPEDSCHPPAHLGKSGTEIGTVLPPLHGTWPSPCYPILDVVEQTLGHERVLVQVDQVRCLGGTNKEPSLSARALRGLCRKEGAQQHCRLPLHSLSCPLHLQGDTSRLFQGTAQRGCHEDPCFHKIPCSPPHRDES